MLHLKFIHTLLISCALCGLTFAAHAQNFDHRASALVEGDVIQENAAAAAELTTQIGSISAEGATGKLDAQAIVKGDVHVDNSAAASNSVVHTNIGSIKTWQSNPDIKSRAQIDHDVVVENSGANAFVNTAIGSVLQPSAAHLRQDATAHIKGSVLIQNSGAQAAVETLAGSIQGTSGRSNMSANADIGGDLITTNTGTNALVETNIGSIGAGMERVAPGLYSRELADFGSVRTSATIKGSVIHTNKLNNTNSAVLIGAVR